jgi:hypothetical protein
MLEQVVGVHMRAFELASITSGLEQWTSECEAVLNVGWRLSWQPMSRGYVGRSDAIESSCVSPGQRSRSSDEASMRGTHQGQQSAGLHQQAGHMTASDTCTTRHITSCRAGAIHT